MGEARPVGRRVGGPDTRGEILAAARAEFAAKGFGRASVRGIAREAGVDPALVHHYFGPKRELYLASLDLPFSPRTELAGALAAGPGDTMGDRLVGFVLRVWDDPERQASGLAVLRSVVQDDDVADVIRTSLLGVLAEVLHEARPDLSDEGVALVLSQVLGLIMARYVARLAPLATMPAEAVVARIGPTLQRYLDAD